MGSFRHFYAEFWTHMFYTSFKRAIKAWQEQSWGANARANTALGTLLELRAQLEGDPGDLRRAAESYQTAAQNGNAEAMVRLGNLTFAGLGVSKDSVLAHNWLSIAVLGRRLVGFCSSP